MCHVSAPDVVARRGAALEATNWLALKTGINIPARVHNSPLCAHVGIDKTADLVHRYYWWPA
jgi:hypothetical protein